MKEFIKSYKELNEITKNRLIVIRGIYFLWIENKIVYVGQSNNIISRVNTHFNDNKKNFDSYNYVEISYEKVENLNNIESYYIHEFQPIYNSSLPVNDYYKSIHQIKKELGLNLNIIKSYLKTKGLPLRKFYKLSDFEKLEHFKLWMKMNNPYVNLKQAPVQYFYDYFKVMHT